MFEEADRALGFPAFEICFPGPEEALKLTANTQPAILTASLAAYRVLEEKGIRPSFVAGHSLGEYSALVAAGALSFSDAVRLVLAEVSICKRPCLKERAPWPQSSVCDRARSLKSAARQRRARSCSRQSKFPRANRHFWRCRCGEAGRRASHRRRRQARGDVTGFRSVPQRIDAAGAERLEKDLRATPSRRSRCRWSPTWTTVIRGGDDAREALIRQVTLPVLWEDSMRELIEEGVTFVEVGPGRVLCGLMRQIERWVPCANVEDLKSLDATQERLAQLRSESAEAS